MSELTPKHGVSYEAGTPMVKARFAWGNIFPRPFHWRVGCNRGPSYLQHYSYPLLRQLQSLSMGTSVNNMYAGGFLHADDIRTLASTSSTLEAQISTVKKFTEDNFLKLNASMCEVVAFKRASNRTFEERIEAGECSFPVGGKATCLGYQWKNGSAENWRRDTRPTSPQQY